MTEARPRATALVASLFAVAAFGVPVSAFASRADAAGVPFGLLAATAAQAVFVAAALGGVAWGLWAGKPWAVPTAVVVAVLAALNGVAIGTLVSIRGGASALDQGLAALPLLFAVAVALLVARKDVRAWCRRAVAA